MGLRDLSPSPSDSEESRQLFTSFFLTSPSPKSQKRKTVPLSSEQSDVSPPSPKPLGHEVVRRDPRTCLPSPPFPAPAKVVCLPILTSADQSTPRFLFSSFKATLLLTDCRRRKSAFSEGELFSLRLSRKNFSFPPSEKFARAS